MRRKLHIAIAAAGFLFSTVAQGLSFHLGEMVSYAKGSAQVSARDMDKLDVFACRLKHVDLEVVIVVGHASARESDAERLAQKRALGIMDALIDRGVDPKKIYTENKGNKQPVSRSPDQAKLDRRVEMEVIGFPKYKWDGGCMSRLERDLYSFDAKRSLAAARGLLRENGWSVTWLFQRVIEQGRPDLLAMLLKSSSGIPLPKTDRLDLLRRAASTGQPAMVQPFIAAWTPHDVPAPWTDILESAACTSDTGGKPVETVRRLAEWGGELILSGVRAERSPLICSSGSDSKELFELLVSNGVDPKQPEWLLAEMGYNPVIVQKLLRAGANPLAATPKGETLFHTFRLDSTTDVNWLLSLGLDINALDRAGNSPLRRAVAYAGREVLDQMISMGATLQESKEGVLLQASVGNPQAFIWLLEHGLAMGDQAELLKQLARQDEKALSAMAALIKRGVDVNQRDSRGRTALAVAIGNYQPQIVRLLLKSGATQDEPDKDMGKGKTALQLAEKLSGYPPYRPPFSYSFVKIHPSPILLQAKREIIELLLSGKHAPMN